MSVKKKLTIGFLSITLLIIILAIMNYSSLQNIKSSINHLMQNNLKKSHLISNSRLSMGKAISNLKTFSMSYKKDELTISKINNELNTISKEISQLKSLSKNNIKEFEEIIKNTNTLKSIIKEQVNIHNQKIALYFEHKNKFQNYEVYFYKINNDFDSLITKINKTLYRGEAFNGNKEYTNSLFYKWYKNRNIENKRLKKYIIKYDKSLKKTYSLINEILGSKNIIDSDKKRIEKEIERINKTSKKIIKTASRTISIIETSEKTNFTSLMKLASGISANLDTLSKVLDKELSSSKEEINDITTSTSTFTIVFSIVAIIISIIIATIASRTINNSLSSFQLSLLAFFKFINKESKEVKLIDIKTKDEFGEMAQLLNENIEISQKKFTQNQNLIDEIADISNNVKQGHLDKRINSSSDDETLETLKINFNTMIDNLENHINKILEVFNEFAKNNFTNQFTIDSQGQIKELLTGVNSLATEFSDILVENKANGLTLEKSSNLLLENVHKLNNASSQSAASLEETAAALEEMTNTIRKNTSNVDQMSQYANNLTKSAKKGQNLATTTTTSMEEINNQVTSINEAITVIDQIAFQTNILSLNAAVEAATAGEAGKGFAVVAQEVRNLASRSAEAAKEIKSLVENANIKANEGKKIAEEMISGYGELNNDISNTLELIEDIDKASKEQLTGIEQINDSISSLDQQTQENVIVSNLTNNIAKQTDQIAKLVVSNADEKEFIGKKGVVAKELNIDTTSEPKKINKKPIERKKIKSTVKVEPKKEVQQIIASNANDDEWESF